MEDTRCKYQYYRAQCACPESQLEDPPVATAALDDSRAAERTGWNIVLVAPAIWTFCLTAALFTASSRLQLEPRRQLNTNDCEELTRPQLHLAVAGMMKLTALNTSMCL